MGYLSCNAESAIATCDSYNWELLTKKPTHNQPNKKHKRPIKITHFDYSDLHSATNAFSSSNLLGKGSHGSVYKAHLLKSKLIAAVKKTKQTHPTTTINPSDNEVEILSRIYHPRLVNLIGFALDPNQHDKLIVVEYMPNGSLHDLLHGPDRKPPNWVKRTRFALQIARAVQFLHSSDPPIIHRDIKSSNVLIDAGFGARLSDFGLALRGHVEDVRVKCTPPAGTLGYLDPGYLAPGDVSSKSDVFSFGILMLEIITGRNAIDVRYSPPSVVDWAVPAIKAGEVAGICDRRIGPPEDTAAMRRMAAVAARCVRTAAERRPEMAEVVECLKKVYRRMKIGSGMCIGLGRRVGEEARVGKYEALEESVGRAGSRRNGRVSSVTGVELGKGVIGGERVLRSKSVGTGSEIRLQPLDERRRVGSGVRMVRLGKSRSMGILQSKRLVNVNGDVERHGTGRRELEESKLLGDDNLIENVGEEEKGSN